MSRRTIVVLAMVGAVAVLFTGALGGSAVGAEKRGKIKACVAKRGPDQGLMRFSRGKCKHGERKVTWNKKGKRGPAGTTGGNGAAGPSNDDLLALIQQQASQIEQLTGLVNGLVPQVAALCSQSSALTDQANDLLTAVSGIDLAGLIPAGLSLDIPGLPAPLSAFSCP